MAKACGAKTSSGEPCKRAPLKGKTRCKLHGGASTGPHVHADISGNKRATIHDVYSRYETDEERAIGKELEILDLFAELRTARLQLIRARKRQSESLLLPELEEEEISSKDGITQKRRVVDHQAIVDRCLARVQSVVRDIKAISDHDPQMLKVLVEGGFTNDDHASSPSRGTEGSIPE